MENQKLRALMGLDFKAYSEMINHYQKLQYEREISKMTIGNPENKEVLFDPYCSTCKYAKVHETLNPCNECLEYAMREGTVKPEKWEPIEK